MRKLSLAQTKQLKEFDEFIETYEQTPILLSIGPKQIGRSFWRTIHAVALTVPLKDVPDFEDRKQYFIDFAYSVCKLFPCSVCRSHCKLSFKPEDIIEDPQLYNYMFLILHNQVRKQQKRQLLTMDNVLKFVLEDVLPDDNNSNAADMNRSSQNTNSDDSTGNDNTNIIIVLIVIIIILISVIIYQYSRKKKLSKQSY